MGFCVKCGKKGIEGSFCEKCYAEEYPLIKDLKDIHIEMCAICNAYRLHHKWNKTESISEAVRAVVKDSIKNKKARFKIVPLVDENILKKGRKIIEVKIYYFGEAFEIPATIEFSRCGLCSKEQSTYFEAVLQLRNPNQEVIDFIHEDIEYARSKGIFLTNEKKVKNGIDFYLTSKKYALLLGQRLKKKFNGILKKSAQLFSRDRQTSKNIYRLNVLFRVLDIELGDIVLVGDKEVKILSIGKRIQGMIAGTRKKVFVDRDQITNIK